MTHRYLVKLRFPDALDIIGIATEQGQEENRSEDFAYLDARDWSPERDTEAKRLQSELHLMQAARCSRASSTSFPWQTSLRPDLGRAMRFQSRFHK